MLDQTRTSLYPGDSWQQRDSAQDMNSVRKKLKTSSVHWADATDRLDRGEPDI